ncbi:MAG TPA: glycosyltransferase family 4 protein [Gammaproteobacteria bacterium]|nr:glycosyltransferase family 4 protein [Gammaproteobacteria bacterium]
MKVLLANKYFFNKGGSETVMFAEREFLLRSDVEVVDFSMRDPRNLPSPYSSYFVANQSYDGAHAGAVSRLRAGAKLVHSQEAVRRIGRLIDATRPDIVHCHNVYHQLTPSIIGAAKRRGVPVVLTLHDYKPVCAVHTRLRHGAPCSDCLDGRYSNVLRYRCADGSLTRSALLYAEAAVQRLLGSYERVDAVIAPSEFMRASVTRWRFPAERVQVIPNGIDTASLSPATDDRGYALYLGRLSPEKGIGTLLEAHEGIADRVPLLVAGTGRLEAQLRARYPRARFLGHLAGAELERTIRDAGFVVVPSEWHENCPLSVLEAMGYGKAVVASRMGGIPELVVHGETGLLVSAGAAGELAQCLVDLASDPARRRRLGAAARARAERDFSLDAHNRALLRLYTALLETADGRERPVSAGFPETNRSIS